jgi:hypothetical protein
VWFGDEEDWLRQSSFEQSGGDRSLGTSNFTLRNAEATPNAQQGGGK